MQNFASSQVLGAAIAFGGTTLLARSINFEILHLLVISIRVGMFMVLFSATLSSIIQISRFSKPFLYKLANSFAVLTVFVGIVWGTNFLLTNKNSAIAQVPTPTASSINVPVSAIHTVEAGESLWMISLKYYGSGSQWKKIITDNESTLIHPGDKLEIPEI
jgi:LysM repeat protein